MFVVKFGGSAITDKTRSYTYLRGRVARAASAFRETQTVFIHGAGSFAHPHVKTFGLTPRGIALTKASLRRLTAMIVEEMLEAGLPAMPVEPSDVFWGRSLARQEVITHALRHGLYPLLHGDIVPSDEGYVVVSGDDMAVELARVYRPRAVVFLMDVDGIYTAPPGSPNAEKIRRLKSNIDLEGTAGVDVTGGIRKKVEAGLAIAALEIPVFYCSITDTESLEIIARGGAPENCTSVEP
jgi:isopentenyl phosphate kinase